MYVPIELPHSLPKGVTLTPFPPPKSSVLMFEERLIGGTTGDPFNLTFRIRCKLKNRICDFMFAFAYLNISTEFIAPV